MEKIRLGVIGLSKGNGHPYSWSAICNGFDDQYMQECPFPVIPQYLTAARGTQDFIENAEVTHIWTQERSISEHVAKASCIAHVVDRPEDMIGQVDAVLLARDDAENHLAMARPFLEAGLMVYIDKPLAFDRLTAEKIYAMEQFEGQIFSCSAMRYARELDELDLLDIGKISYIDATTMKRWDTYAAHIIDPVLRIVGDTHRVVSSAALKNENTQGETLQLEDGTIVSLHAHKTTPVPISLRIIGDKGERVVTFNDTFYAFRGALRAFIASVQAKKSVLSKAHVMTLVDWIERGL